ncbi:MAG: PTS sugar transporter subunit IIA [Tetragenococcus koreensis]|uniref:PTS sugar transporter subunit IIA n=1 Tax=Tetragenococcus halophilus TaxID=51669 RepID=UPI00264B395B|nr:PTS sugar transporter subunit IIA [Tetragenococcus koreensis]
MFDFSFLPELIIPNLAVNSKEEAITYLSKLLEDSRLVERNYKNDVLSREKEFSTGLPVKNGAIAIPHAKSTHVFNNGVAVGTLKKSVYFNSMEDSNLEIPVDMVMLLAISESDKQLKMLQAIMRLLSNEEIIDTLKNKKGSKDIAKQFTKLI